MLEADVPREISFELPEGQFDAIITGVKPFVKQAAKKTQNWVRFLFTVEVPGMENFDCMAGRNFNLNLKSGSDLRNWLTGLLGKEFFKSKSGTKINLEALTGLKCVVELKHVYGKGDYDKPLVVVETITPQLPEDTGGKD